MRIDAVGFGKTNAMEKMDVFSTNFLVVGLPQSVIDEIASLASYQVFAAGETMIRKGDSGGDLFVILEGTVDVLSDQDDLLASAGQGNVIGEVALVDAQPRSADVVCKGLTKVARLPAKELRAYMAQNKDAGFIMLANLSRVLSMRLRNAQVVLEDLKVKAQEDPWKYAF